MNSSNRNQVLPTLIGSVVVGLLCMLCGLMIALLPTGIVLRVVFFLVLAIVLVLAWLARGERRGLPPTIVSNLLLLTIALSILWPRFIFFPIGGVSANPQSISVLLTLTLCIVIIVSTANISRADSLSALNYWHIGWLIAIWFAWRLVSSITSDSPVPATIALTKEFIYSASFIVLTAVLLIFPDAEKKLLKTIVLCGAIAAAFGLAEATLQKNFLIQFASGGATEEAADSLRFIAIEKIRDGAYRAQSFFTHPIVFAQFIAALLPLSLLLLVTEKRSFVWRAVCLLTIPIGVLAIVKSGSRAGLVSILASVGFMLFIVWLRFLRSKGTRKMFALLAGPIFLLTAGVIGKFVHELTQGRSAIEAGSTSARMEMLDLGIKALDVHPILGYGQGSSVYVAGLTNSQGLTSIDSYLLSIAIDSGYPGLLLFLILVLTVVSRLTLLASKHLDTQGLATGMIAASIVALFATFVTLSTAHNMTLMWILIVFGLFYAKRLSDRDPTARDLHINKLDK